jgi:hypothetical protein
MGEGGLTMRGGVLMMCEDCTWGSTWTHRSRRG